MPGGRIGGVAPALYASACLAGTPGVLDHLAEELRAFEDGGFRCGRGHGVPFAQVKSSSLLVSPARAPLSLPAPSAA